MRAVCLPTAAPVGGRISVSVNRQRSPQRPCAAQLRQESGSFRHLSTVETRRGLQRTGTVVVMDSFGAVRKLQQSLNVAGVSLFVRLLTGRDRQLAVPHISLRDISSVDWEALSKAGFRGVVFDKDNTLTAPYAPRVEPCVEESLQTCRRVFADRVVLLSNSAGLKQYDPEGREAEAIEKALGIAVLRHSSKKPSGDCTALESHFGCQASDLIMVGDRYLTDVVYGNRHGMLTIRTQPFTLQGAAKHINWLRGGESKTVKAARWVEQLAVKRWTAAGVGAPKQRRLAESGAGGGAGAVAAFVRPSSGGDPAASSPAI